MVYKSLLLAAFSVAGFSSNQFAMQANNSFLEKARELSAKDCLNWAKQHKAPLFMGLSAGALVGAGLAYYFNYLSEEKTREMINKVNQMNDDEIKASIRKENQDYLIAAAQRVRNGAIIFEGKIPEGSSPPSKYDYVMVLGTIQDNDVNIGIRATYQYACDHSTETVNILFTDLDNN